MQTMLEPQSLASTSLQELMREMLVRLGEDPERDGLQHTPERMERIVRVLTLFPKTGVDHVSEAFRVALANLAATQKFERSAERVTYRKANEAASDLVPSLGDKAKD